jgi:hypothetical protein
MLRQRLRLQRAESVRTHRHWWWHVEVEPCTTSLPSPGDRQDVSGVLPAARAFRHKALVILLGAARAS